MSNNASPYMIVCTTCLHVLFAGESSPVQTVAALRSVTHYKFGTQLQDLSIEQLARDVARARDIGFNGMWLVVTWRSLSPVALPVPQFSSAPSVCFVPKAATNRPSMPFERRSRREG